MHTEKKVSKRHTMSLTFYTVITTKYGSIRRKTEHYAVGACAYVTLNMVVHSSTVTIYIQCIGLTLQ